VFLQLLPMSQMAMRRPPDTVKVSLLQIRGRDLVLLAYRLKLSLELLDEAENGWCETINEAWKMGTKLKTNQPQVAH
jgi:hypothetical protein